MTAAPSGSSTRRWARVAAAFSLTVSLVVIPANPALAVTDTYRDNFNAGFSGSDGSAAWATDWIEAGESDGPGTGGIKVEIEPHCASGACLTLGRLATGGGNASVEREVDLSLASSATLQFDFKRHDHVGVSGQVVLEVYPNGGGGWDPLQTWDLSVTDPAPAPATHDISDYLSVDTRIRFRLINDTDQSHFNVDNFVITAENDLSPYNRGIVINEILSDAHSGPSNQEQFVELFNATAGSVALDGWELQSESGPFYTFPVGVSLGPGEYAVVWTRDLDLGGLRDAPAAAFQDGAGQSPNFLSEVGDAVWLLDSGGARVDFVAWGTGVGSPPPEWDGTHETSYGDGATAQGQSISLTPNGVDGNTSACWEPTTSGDAAGRCAGALPTSDFPPVAQLWSPGVSNQAVPNQPPVFDQDLLDRSDSEGTLIIVSAAATDPDLDTLTYSATGLPEGVSLDPDTGLVTGALSPNAAGAHAVTITVTDDGIPNEQDVDTFTWTVTAGEVAYLVANGGGGNGGDDQLTAVDLSDPNPATNEINIGTGTGTWNIESAALQPGSDTLLAIENDQVGTIDLTTGVFTALPSIVGSGNGPVGLITFDNVESLSFNPFTAHLYGTHRRGLGNEDVLFRIDPTTGAIVTGAFGGNDYVPIQVQATYYHVADLAFDPTDGQLYGIHWDLGGLYSIAIIDPISGATTTIGATVDDIGGLAFDGAGRLWGTTNENPGTDLLYEFDKTDATVISTATIDNGVDYESIAISFPFTPNQPPVFDQDLLDRTDAEGSPISLPAPATDPDVGDILLYTANGLPPGLTINPTSGLVAGTVSFAASGVYAVEITATDNGIPNLTDTDTFAWTITESNQAPVFDQDLLDRSDAEGDAISISAGATDPDAGDNLLYGATGLPAGLTIEPTTGLISGTLSFTSAGSHPVDITVTDNGTPNLQDVDLFTWTVTNTNRPPVIIDPGAQTTPELAPFSLTVAASDPDLTIPSFSDGGTLPPWATLTDNLDGTATISGTPGGGDSGTTSVTITADDGLLSDDAVFDLTVTNTNQAPVIVNPGDQSGAENTPFTATVSATDPDTTIPTLTATGLPAWATLTDNLDGTATITGTPGYTDANTTTVTVTASDGSLTDEAIFNITITNTNRPPVVNPVADQTVAEADPFTLTVTASDPDTTIPALTATGLPAWATLTDNLDGTATITGTPGYTDTNTTTVTITANDGTLTDDTTFTLTVTNTNRPPVVNPIADQTVAEADSFLLVVTASDPDLTVPFLNVAGLPSWATFTDNLDGTATISGTPGYTDANTHLITITATDDGALSATETFDLTVTNTNQAPVIVNPGDQSGAENTPFTATVSATDPDTTIPTLTATGLPAWATLTDNLDGTATITGTPGYTDANTTTVTVTASDGSLTDEAIFNITITNTNRPPVVNPVADQTVAEADPFTLTVTASDPDTTIPALTATGLPAWATLTDNLDGTATITGTPGYTDTNTTTVTITANDGTLTDDTTFTLTVTNTNRPPVVNPIADQTVAEADSFLLVVTASDPDLTVPFLNVAGLPAWATLTDNLDGTATITGTPGYTDANTHLITITANDGTLTDDTTFTLIVTNTNRPPKAEDDALLLPAEAASTVFSVLVNDADPDGDDLTVVSFDPTGIGTLTEEGGGTFRYVPGPGTPYAETFTYTVEDPAGAASTATVFVSVSAPAALPPLPPVEVPALIGLGPISGVELRPVYFTAAVTIEADVTFSLIGAPRGSTIDPTTGSFTWTPTEADGPGAFSFVVRLADADTGAVLDETAIDLAIAEVDSPPTLRPTGLLTAEPGSVFTTVLSAHDPDLPTQTPRFEWSGPAPAGASIDPRTGEITWTVASGELIGQHELAVRVRDEADPSLFDEMTVVVMVGAASSSDRKATLIAQLIPPADSSRAATPVVAEKGIPRTLAIMARAGMGSARALGTPFILFLLLAVFVLSVGRISLHPLLGRSRRMEGTVAWFDGPSGYGFILPDDSAGELFVHRSALTRGRTDVIPGERVSFRIVKGGQRSFALHVKGVER